MSHYSPYKANSFTKQLQMLNIKNSKLSLEEQEHLIQLGSHQQIC